jgi:hypothetical protein
MLIFNYTKYEQDRWDDVPTEEELFISDLKHNDTPRKRKQDKDYILPTQELFRTWLFRYANLDERMIEHTIKQYRKMIKQLWRFPFNTDIDINDLDFDEHGTEIT